MNIRQETITKKCAYAKKGVYRRNQKRCLSKQLWYEFRRERNLVLYVIFLFVRKIMIVNGNKKPWHNDEGFVIMGMKYFLLNADSLEF